MSRITRLMLRVCSLLMLCLPGINGFAQSGDFPDKPSPPRLVNDLAHTMSPDNVALLERKLTFFSDSTSNQVSIVTVRSIGNYDISDYTFKLGNKWGIGTKAHNNGILILAAINDRKIFIATGRGLEGALTDIVTKQIIDNEITPSFKEGRYYEGFEKATTAIIAATKGEYKGEGRRHNGGGIPVGTIVIVIVIVIIIASASSGGGGRGGRYMSGRGFDSFGGGFLGGSIFGSGFGGGSSDSGGFGGFGGGSFGGGGAGGSW